jgi:hypothetical protein
MRADHWRQLFVGLSMNELDPDARCDWRDEDMPCWISDGTRQVLVSPDTVQKLSKARLMRDRHRNWDTDPVYYRVRSRVPR